jgi:hypothetical protein
MAKRANRKKQENRAKPDASVAIAAGPSRSVASPAARSAVPSNRPQTFPWMILFQAGLLIAVGVGIYWPALHGMWLWDDDYLLQKNAVVQDPQGLWWIWSDPVKYLIDFFPMTVSVEWLLWQIFHGPNPDTMTPVLHITTLIFHLVNCLLVWLLFSKLRLRLAWLGAMIFAVHPILVESVAWMAELKNTLSGMPFLLCMCAWIDFDRKRRPEEYVAAALLFAIALLCKTAVVPFPFVMLLYAWWKRGRIDWRDVAYAAPFVVLAVLDYVGLSLVMKKGVGEEFIPLGGLTSRIACTGLSIAFYFSKCFLPIHLLPIYPRWDVNPPSLFEFLPWLAMAGVFIYLWERRKGWGRHALLGLGFFLIMVGPYCGLVKISFMRFQWFMDHMVYMPIVGLIGLTIAALSHIDTLLPARHRPWRVAGVTVVIIAMAVSSRGYAGIYLNTIELWSYEVRQYPEAWVAHNNLGNALIEAHRYNEAIVQVDAALALNPLYTEAHNNRGFLLARQGRLTEAVQEFNAALAITPDFEASQVNLKRLLDIQAKQAQSATPPKAAKP